MKRITRLYENLNESIKISFLAFLMIAFGFLIQNKTVNIFYTFTSPFILGLADGVLKIGQMIILNLPIIFMVNFVCKKENSHLPIILAFVGYFTFLIVISLIDSQTLPSYAYNQTFAGIFNLLGVKKVYETGMIGSLLVGLVTRLSFIQSRHNNNFSLSNIVGKNIAAILFEIIYCTILAAIFALIYPLFFKLVGNINDIIATNLASSKNIGLYGILDRIYSILGINNIIRYPFWFTSAGGSYTSVAGKVIEGDVNIWRYIEEAAETYNGAGRFITGYYVINIFMVPAIYLGIWFSVRNKNERLKMIFPLVVLCLVSIVCGNPLPLELMLLFTAPLLLLIYLIVVGAVFFYLSNFGLYLGYNAISLDTVTAMPGNLPDYLINMRNAMFSGSISKIFLVGIIVAMLAFGLTLIYYRFLAYDVLRTGRLKSISNKIIKALGGKENIASVTSDIFNVEFELVNLDLVSYDELKELNVLKIFESKKGIGIELGTSSLMVCDKIEKILLKD